MDDESRERELTQEEISKITADAMARHDIRDRALALAIDQLVALDRAGFSAVPTAEIATALAQVAIAQQLQRIADALNEETR